MKWKPKEGEEYHYIMLGECEAGTHKDNNFDNRAVWEKKIGNCFRTKKEAQAKLNQIKKILKGE